MEARKKQETMTAANLMVDGDLALNPGAGVTGKTFTKSSESFSNKIAVTGSFAVRRILFYRWQR